MKKDLRDVAAAEMSAFFTDEPGRPDSEWRRTIETAREMLAGLERTREATDEKLKLKRARAAAWVSNLVEKLVAAATIETEAAVKRARAEAETDAAQLQALVTHLQAESEAQREEISRLQRRLESEKARHARLAAAFETVQRAVSFVDRVEPASELAAEPAVAPQPTALPPPAASHPLKLVSSIASAEPNTELEAYVKQLFDQIESVYWADLGASMGPADIVGRLTENLRHAHDAFGRRVTSGNAAETLVFERHLTTQLDAKSETSFGRHLAIAAYNYSRPETLPTRVRVDAS